MVPQPEMKQYTLPKDDVEALVAFLQTVRSHGFPSHDFDVLFR
jgi:hypothetical protein